MDLLNASALWLLPLLAVLLLAPRLAVPRPPRYVSNLYLWQGAVSRAVPLLTRVRRHARLLLDAAILLLVVFAIARPALVAGGRYAAVVVDVSASMGALDRDGTRLDAARRRTLEIADALPRGSRVRLLSAGPVVRDHGEWGAGDRRLRSALAALVAADGAAALDEAIATATAASPPGAEVWVVTDRPRGADDATRVRWNEVGLGVDNVAITAMALRTLPSSPLDAELLIEIRSFAAADTDVPLVVEHDGEPMARERVRLAPGAARTIVLEVARPQGTYTAAIHSDDALASDNRRSTAASRQRRLRVTLVGAGGGFFLERALAAHPDVELTAVDTPGAAATGADVVVCYGCAAAPSGAPATLLIPRGQPAGPEAPLSLSPLDHPLTAGLDVLDAAAVPLDGPPTEQGEVLIRAAGRPVLVARERAGSRVAVLHADVERPAFALSVAFPVLVANALDWLSAARDGRAAEEASPWPLDESDLRKDAAPAPTAPQASSQDTRVEGRIELTALLLGLAALLLVLDAVRHKDLFTPRHLRVLRAASATAVLLAAAGLRLPAGEGAMSVAFAIDKSASIPAREASAAAARAAEMSSHMRTGDRSALVVFGAEPLVEAGAQDRALPARSTSRVRESGTDIAAALRLSRSMLSAADARRIVLFSDGRENSGAALREAAAAAANAVSIDTVALASAETRRVRPSRISAPARVAAGAPFVVSADLDGPPGAPARVVISRDDVEIHARDVRLDADGHARIAVEERRERPGHATYVASVLEPGDLPESAATAGAVVTVFGRASVLHVAPRATAMPALLRDSGFSVQHSLPAAVPSTARGLDAFDLVVLETVPASALSAAQARAIARHVEASGGGLLVLGGPATLDPAGYPRTPLGGVLPLDLSRQQGTRASDLALVLVFDKSGSMADRTGGVPKIELARRAVHAVAGLLPASDAFGVIAFDAAPADVAPLRAGHDPAAIEAALDEVRPGGATAIAPAVERARAWLRASPASRRHILLVSDGRSNEADGARLMALARSRDIELSVVATGDDADRDFFRRLAQAGRGRVHFPEDMRRLPDIVAREAARTSGAWRVDERFTPRAPAAHPVLAGIDRSAIPALDSYTAGAARPTADIILQSHLGDAVLAAWRYGLGRVAVFTAEPTPAFVRWPGSGAMWTQASRWLARGRDASLLRASIAAAPEGLSLVVDARTPGGSYANGLTGAAEVRAPGGEAQSIPLRQTGPGRYEGAFRPSASGGYRAAIALGSGETSLHALAGVYWNAAREQRGAPPDRGLLERIASTTGGRVLESGESPFELPRPRAWLPVRFWLALAALVLFTCEVAARKGLTPGIAAAVWRARRSGRTHPESAPA